jgi:hypothetical protein
LCWTVLSPEFLPDKLDCVWLPFELSLFSHPCCGFEAKFFTACCLSHTSNPSHNHKQVNLCSLFVQLLAQIKRTLCFIQLG